MMQPAKGRGFLRALMLCLCALWLCGCMGTASYTVHQVDANPLASAATALNKEYKVKQVADDEVHLKRNWPICSIFGMGPYHYMSDLKYRDGKVYGRHYLKAHSIATLWMPMYRGSGPGFYGAALQQFIEDEQRTVTRAIGGSQLSDQQDHYKNPKKETGREFFRVAAQ